MSPSPPPAHCVSALHSRVSHTSLCQRENQAPCDPAWSTSGILQKQRPGTARVTIVSLPTWTRLTLDLSAVSASVHSLPWVLVFSSKAAIVRGNISWEWKRGQISQQKAKSLSHLSIWINSDSVSQKLVVLHIYIFFKKKKTDKTYR